MSVDKAAAGAIDGADVHSEKVPSGNLMAFLSEFATRRAAKRASYRIFLAQARKHAESHRSYLATHRRPTPRPGFNLFRILGIDRREVKTHSAMLRELLDPLGLHGQGNIFLRAFVEMLWSRSENSGPIPPAAFGPNWVVECERKTNKGRLDIVLENAEAGIGIVIENKVDAQDQPLQIKRYVEWQNTVQVKCATNLLIVYLTPDGHAPTDKSTGDEKNNKNLIQLSYRRDIADALDSTESGVQAAEIKLMLRQYIALIRRM